MENSKEPGKKKINDEDLGTVSGGCGKKTDIDPHNDERFVTKMVCSNRECKYRKKWRGNYLDGKTYLCPNCGRLSFRGWSVEMKE